MATFPEKLTRWLIFSVLISLVPLFTSYVGQLLDHRTASLDSVTGRGELLLITTTLAAAAIGELIPSGRERGTQKLLAGGSCIVIVLFSSLLFAAVQSRLHPGGALVFGLSLSLFCGTLLASGSCLYLAHEVKP
jgi:hypothetical protein